MTPDWYDTLVGDWHRPLHAVVKVVLLFLTAVVAFRLTQRRTLAQLAPFDWVAVAAVGAIIGRTATATDASFLTGAAALVALLVAHGVVTRLRFLPGVARITDPPGVVLVRDGAVVARNLRRSGITDADPGGAAPRARSPVPDGHRARDPRAARGRHARAGPRGRPLSPSSAGLGWGGRPTRRTRGAGALRRRRRRNRPGRRPPPR